jgi:hypothetical protein
MSRGLVTDDHSGKTVVNSSQADLCGYCWGKAGWAAFATGIKEVGHGFRCTFQDDNKTGRQVLSDCLNSVVVKVLAQTHEM